MTGKEFKEKLMVLLIRKKMTITDLAAIMGITQQAISNRFQIKDISTGFLENICKSLKVSILEFYPEYAHDRTTITQTFTNIHGGETNISEGDVTHQGSNTSEQEDRELIKQLIEQNSKLIDFLNKNK